METEPGTLRPRPVADLTPENLKTIVEDIGGPGWYTSASLYAWYVGMCKETNLDPVTHRKFGGVLAEMGYRTAIRRVEGKHSRCWLITRRAVREGADRG